MDKTALLELLLAGFFAVGCIRAHAPLQEGSKAHFADFFRLTGRIERCGDLTSDGGAGWVTDVDDEDARVRMRARIQAVCPARVTKPATTRAVRTIAHVQEIFVVGGGRVHSPSEKRVLAYQLDVFCCAWSSGMQQRSAC